MNKGIPLDTVKFTETIQSTNNIYDAINKAFSTKTKFDVLSNNRWGAPKEDKEKDDTSASPAATGGWL